MKQLSNILSLSRVPLAGLIALALSYDQNVLAVIICLIAAATDIGDGYFARKFNSVSELGRILDPLSDKILYAVIVITLLAEGRMPLWFAAAIVVRDLLILIGGIFVGRRMKIVIPSNYIGKATVVVIGLTFLWIITDFQMLVLPFEIASCAGLAASLVSYTIGMLRRLKESAGA